MKTPFHVTQPDNPLLEGLKQLMREAVREEIQNSLKGQNQQPEPLLLDTEAAAKLLAVPETWLAAAARSRKVSSVRLGAYVRFKRCDLEKYILQIKDQGEKETPS
jgi:excisionase family DNA binding protein